MDISISDHRVIYNKSRYQRTNLPYMLPREWPGTILFREGEWVGATEKTIEFQEQVGIRADGKLGPDTLRRLCAYYDNLNNTVSSATAGRSALTGRPVLTTCGGIDFREPEDLRCPPEKLVMVKSNEDQAHKRFISFYNSYGGPIFDAREIYGLNVAALALAIMAVESSGDAYQRDGLLTIRVEIPGRWTKDGSGERLFRGRFGSGQQAEWKALREWAGHAPKLSFDRTSWGLVQIMGFNAKKLDYRDATHMALAFQCAAKYQVFSFFKFVLSFRLLDIINREDWRGFARAYNGPGNVDNYSAKVERHYATTKFLMTNV